MSINLKTALQATGWKGSLLAHVMVWFGNGAIHRVNRYLSTDTSIINDQLFNMQDLGIDGVIITYQGYAAPGTSFGHVATRKFAEMTAAKGMLFGLLLDPWIAKNLKPDPTTAVITQLQSADVQDMLASPSYLPGKPILEFDLAAAAGVSVPKLQAAFPGNPILSKHVGYSWPEITNTLATLATDNKNPTMQIPGLCLKFNDGGYPLPGGVNGASFTGRDYSKSVWDATQACRVIESQGGNFYMDQALLVPKGAPYAAIVTWNDHDEQTAIEDFAVMASGVRIGK